MLPTRLNQVINAMVVGTLSIVAAVITTATITTGTVTNLTATVATSTTAIVSGSLQVGTSGTPVKKLFRATATYTPQATITAGGTTSTVITVTGAAAGDHCTVNVTSGGLFSTTSTGVLSCQASSNAVTVSVYNATSTSSFAPGASNLSIVDQNF